MKELMIMSNYEGDFGEQEVEMYCFNCKTMQTFTVYQAKLFDRVAPLEVKCLGCTS